MKRRCSGARIECAGAGGSEHDDGCERHGYGKRDSKSVLERVSISKWSQWTVDKREGCLGDNVRSRGWMTMMVVFTR